MSLTPSSTLPRQSKGAAEIALKSKPRPTASSSPSLLRCRCQSRDKSVEADSIASSSSVAFSAFELFSSDVDDVCDGGDDEDAWLP